MKRSWWLTIAFLGIGIGSTVLLDKRLGPSDALYKDNLQIQAPLQQMEAPERGEKILIFAPHEDDETLGCSGYIQQAVASGADIHIVMMTNGEYPEADVMLFEETLSVKPKNYVRLGYMRQKETLAAVRSMGLTSTDVTFLGYPNQYLDQMWSPKHWLRSRPIRSRRTQATKSPYGNSMTLHAVYCGHSVLQDIKTVMVKYQPDTVVTLHPNDIHVDHWPTGAFVQFALEELRNGRNEWAESCKVRTYLIHRDLWPAPRSFRPWMDLEPPAGLSRIIQSDWYKLPLTKQQLLSKQRATGIYRTQLGHYDPLLRSFSRTNELFGVQQPHIWKRNKYSKPRTVIVDPAKDTVSSSANSHADIQAVTLSRNADMMALTITTRGTASPYLQYHVSIHAGGSSADDRMIAQYSWVNNDVNAHIICNGKLLSPNTNDFNSTASGNLATIKTFWPLDDSAHSFFIIRAWTTKKNSTHCIDQTASTLFRMTE